MRGGQCINILEISEFSKMRTKKIAKKKPRLERARKFGKLGLWKYCSDKVAYMTVLIQKLVFLRHCLLWN